MSGDTLPSPDVLVKRSQFTRTGAPVRLLTLATSAAEDWVIANVALGGDVSQLARSLVVPKASVADVVEAMKEDGLVVRELIRADPTVLPKQRSGHD